MKHIYFRAFTGKYNKNSEAGIYTCVVCNEELFTSETKFDSGCGWPAFNDVIDQNKVKLTSDTSNGMPLNFCKICGFVTFLYLSGNWKRCIDNDT